MSLYVHGIGLALPEHSIDQSDAAEVAKTFCAGSAARHGALTSLYRRSGVTRRHSVVLESSTNSRPARQSFYPAAAETCDRGPTLAQRIMAYEFHAPRLAQQAALAAIDEAGVSARDVSHLITVSCTGFHAPGVDVALIGNLGLRPDTSRTHIGFMGCHGALNGLRVAHAYLGADPSACVLLCAVELCSLHYQYGGERADHIVANSLFADGAAAFVAGAGARSEDDWMLSASGSTIVPDSESVMTWHIRDHGFEMTLGREVPGVIQKNLRPWLENWLWTQGLGLGDIAVWAIHPGGPKILSACAQSCGLSGSDLDVSASVLAEMGNMSSPTILFILDRLRRERRPTPCVALAFGPGLTIEAALFG